MPSDLQIAQSLLAACLEADHKPGKIQFTRIWKCPRTTSQPIAKRISQRACLVAVVCYICLEQTTNFNRRKAQRHDNNLRTVLEN